MQKFQVPSFSQTSLSCPAVRRKLCLSSTTASRSRASPSIRGARSLDALNKKILNSASNKMENRLQSLRVAMPRAYLGHLSGRTTSRKTLKLLCFLRLRTGRIIKSYSSFYLSLPLRLHNLTQKMKGSKVVGNIRDHLKVV